MKRVLAYCLILLLSAVYVSAVEIPVKKVLVLVEGKYDMESLATAHGRQMAQLLGHFKTIVTVDGVNSYKPHDID
ncbi:MAG TPA: hypothetical protein VIH57_09615, partial [Bacteroidales bacterium]